MVEIQFTQDFANRQEGSKWECDSMLASQLVNIDQVAVYTNKDMQDYSNSLKAKEEVIEKSGAEIVFEEPEKSESETSAQFVKKK